MHHAKAKTPVRDKPTKIQSPLIRKSDVQKKKDATPKAPKYMNPFEMGKDLDFHNVKQEVIASDAMDIEEEE